MVLFNSADAERDVFNEKPSKEDIVAATQVKLPFFIHVHVFWQIAVIYWMSWYDWRMPRYYKTCAELFNSISPKWLYILSKVPKICGGIQLKYDLESIFFLFNWIQSFNIVWLPVRIWFYNYKYEIMIMRHSNTCWKYVKREINYIFFMI